MGLALAKLMTWKYGSRHRTPTADLFLLQRLGFPGTSYAGTLRSKSDKKTRLVHTLNGSGLALVVRLLQ